MEGEAITEVPVPTGGDNGEPSTVLEVGTDVAMVPAGTSPPAGASTGVPALGLPSQGCL